MRLSVRTLVAACAPLFVLTTFGATASRGQLTPVGDPIATVFGGDATASQPAGGEFALSVVGDLHTFTGDAHFQLPKNPPAPQFSAFVVGTQRVTVGPLPVQITPTATADFKLVNGGGPASTTFPKTTVITSVSVSEFTATGAFDAVYMPGPEHVQTGNGFTIVDDSFGPPPSYVLAAGITYDLALQYAIHFDITGAPTIYPTIVVTLEAGGISDWPGFIVDFNAVVVPEPGLMSAMAAALMLLAAARQPTRSEAYARRSTGK